MRVVQRGHTAILAIMCWLAASGVVPACCWSTAPQASAQHSQAADPHAHHHAHHSHDAPQGMAQGLSRVAVAAAPTSVPCNTKVEAILRFSSGSEPSPERVAAICAAPAFAFAVTERPNGVILLAPPGD